MVTRDEIEKIRRMKENNVFDNYIEYIVFPYYKNLVQGTRINFEYPLTVLIGKNGSGKSSTLHALFGAPQGYTCSDFWFSTNVDPIAESGDRNRYFYGYKKSHSKEIFEVLKLRMKRGSETKKEDLDYWETSRPVKRDGMISTKRNSPVNKKVIYLDFRAEVSAFDKIFHFSKEGLQERKALLRQRSIYLKRLFENEPMRFPGPYADKVGTMEVLSEEMVNQIGYILNKEYVDIRVAEHKLYKNFGTSVYIRTKNESGYSEANAGSGEIAVVQLVRRIAEAEEYSLVLLDEPEVSLHPGAQEKLKEFLLEAIKRKKLQIIISTHSMTLIEGLPNEAIKLFKTDEKGKFFVVENVNYQEAFFDIEERVKDKKIIYCEDYAAKILIQKCLMHMGKNQYFEVIYPHGGEKNLVDHYMTSIAMNKNLLQRVFFVLDGDMDTGYVFKEEDLTLSQRDDPKYLLDAVKNAFGMELKTYPDGGKGGTRIDQKCDEYLSYLRCYRDNVFFLPSKMIPEQIILESNIILERYRHIIQKVEDITKDNAKEIVENISVDEYGDNEHVDDVILMLSNKWSNEDSLNREKLKEILQIIFEK